eukprot:GHVS01040057.1.p1 GENE.GHVS01040057.1~~GHVS01040057.1.p1  ORF type:complete len:886 (+),score=111.96 GHVS01040057.1:288-2660(+)
MTGLLMGYDLCVVAVVLDPIKHEFQLCGTRFTCLSKQLFVSMVAPGAAVGSLTGGVMSDIFGRRLTLALSDVCFVIGSFLMGFGQHFWMLLLGRIFIGLGVGIGFVVFSTYISEVSPADRRGQLVTCQEVAQCAGCLVAYLVAAIYGSEDWRVLLGSAGVFAVFQLIGVAILPESPRWYVCQGKVEEAAKVLRRLGIAQNEEELTDMIRAMQKERKRHHKITSLSHSIGVHSLHNSSTERKTMRQKASKVFLDLLEHRWQLGIAVGCAVCQNLTAANSVLYYSTDIFRLSGVCDPFLPGVGIGVMKLAGVLAAILLVERWGRKQLLMFGSFGTFICHIMFMAVFAVHDSAAASIASHSLPLKSSSFEEASCSLFTESGAAPTLFMLIASARTAVGVMLAYMFFWNISWAGLMFVVASEVLPSSIRGMGMGLTITAFWLMAFLVQSTLETLFEAITKTGTFGIYAVLNLLVIFFICYVIPETTGKSLEQISEGLEEEPNQTALAAAPNCAEGFTSTKPDSHRSRPKTLHLVEDQPTHHLTTENNMSWRGGIEAQHGERMEAVVYGKTSQDLQNADTQHQTKASKSTSPVSRLKRAVAGSSLMKGAGGKKQGKKRRRWREGRSDRVVAADEGRLVDAATSSVLFGQLSEGSTDGEDGVESIEEGRRSGDKGDDSTGEGRETVTGGRGGRALLSFPETVVETGDLVSVDLPGTAHLDRVQDSSSSSSALIGYSFASPEGSASVPTVEERGVFDLELLPVARQEAATNRAVDEEWRRRGGGLGGAESEVGGSSS